MSDVPKIIPVPTQYLNADVALTGSLVQYFSQGVDAGVKYDFEGMLFFNLSGAGIVTTSTGVVGSSPPARQNQIAEASAATAIKSAAGTGDQTIASGSIATGIHSVIVRGSVEPTAAGQLFLSISTGGAGNLLTGSKFRVWRSE